MDAGAVLPFAQKLANRLGQIDGIVAVVLGGSQARGDATPNSDIDLGIYYDPARLPSLEALRKLGGELDDQHRHDSVTRFGEWGPWINGGAWLTIEGQRVDWLYRDLGKVEQAVSDCEAGRPSVFLQAGHPYGFCTHIYMGEVFYAQPLYTHDETLTSLKTRAAVYPPKLKTALIGGLWEADFSLENCHKSAARGDAFYVSGLLFRSVAVMVQALFALNERYCINEKGAVALIETMPLHPLSFSRTVNEVFGAIGSTPAAMQARIASFENLVVEVRDLCERTK